MIILPVDISSVRNVIDVRRLIFYDKQNSVIANSDSIVILCPLQFLDVKLGRKPCFQFP